MKSENCQNKVERDKRKMRGFSLVETLVAAALMLIVFGGIFSGLQLMMQIITHSKAEAGARSLAIERLEYIRSLSYFDIGTIGGIPHGPIPQYATSTLNGIDYDIRTLILYIDRPEDGEDEDDAIPEDSKIVKITYSWTILGDTQSFTLISDIAPIGMESTAGGGTLKVKVYDADIEPVDGAEVHVYNDVLATTTDVRVYTNAEGVVNFPGAPAGAGYQITVTKPKYSTDQTYSASSTNESPSPTHVSVEEGLISTNYFYIDELSDLTIRAIGTPVTHLFSDSFSSSAQIFSATGTAVSDGAVMLRNTGGVYTAVGSLYATPTVPTVIDAWEYIDFNGTTTASSSYVVQLYSVSGHGSTTSFTLVPEGDLSGNEAGYSEGPVDITSLDADRYDALTLGATFTTDNPNETAALYDWHLNYIESEPLISGVTLAASSSKTIGDHAGHPVYKYSNIVTTEADGEVELEDIEWDDYHITINGGIEGYDIAQTSDPIPFQLRPGISDTVTFVLAPHVSNSLRTTVVDVSGMPIAGATVHLSNGTFDETKETSIYGQVFFNNGVASSTDYTLTVTKDGLDTDTQTNMAITGTVEHTVVLGVGGGEGGDTGSEDVLEPYVAPYLSGYDTRVSLSISGTSLFGDVYDFPVYLDLADMPSSFFDTVQADGDDIRITESDGTTEVSYELVSIDTLSGTGELHFRAPALLTATSSVFYVYYDNATAGPHTPNDSYGRNNVWSNNYLAVYHLEEAASGSNNNGVYVDATGHGGDGDDYVDASGKTGKLGKGQEFNDYYMDNIEIPHTILDGETDVTLTFWYRTDSNTHMTVLSGAKYNDYWGDGPNEYLFWFAGGQQAEFFSHGSPRVEFSINSIVDNTWRYYVSVRDDMNNLTRLFINANEDNQSPAIDSMSALSIAPGGLFIGVDQDWIGGWFGQAMDGELDELRIVRGVRDANWISNVYLNQNTPTDFYTIGSVEMK